MLLSDKLPEYKDRKVFCIEDITGNTGKSWFQKWLRLGQTELVIRNLPVSNVDRLMSAVHIINKTLDVDVYCIDLTRTKGEDQSYKDLFSAIEQIKNGSVIDLMYGKYNESYFEPPVILIFTNNTLFNAESPKNDFSHYLSEDRWIHLLIMKDELHIKQQKHYPYVTKVNKKVNDRAATNNSIQFIQSTASSSVDWKLEDNTDQLNNF